MRNNILLFLTLFSGFASAQESLSLKEAIALGIKNNYNIHLAKNDSVINENNTNIGNAGFLPTLSIIAGTNKSSNNINQEFSNGLSVKKNNVGANAANAGLALNWTLFDGLKMFVTLDKLKEIKKSGELKIRESIEITIVEITSAYFNVAKAKAQQKVVAQMLQLMEERVRIAEAKLTLGNGNKSDLLQAKVDLNEQKSAAIKQETAEANAITNLLTIIGIPPNKDYQIVDTSFANVVLWQELLGETSVDPLNNATLQLFQKNISLAHFNFLELKTTQYPKIALGVNYNFTTNKNQAGFALLNQNLGLTAGLNLNWTLFNGFNTQRNIENAKFAEIAAKMAYEQEKLRQTGLFLKVRSQLSEALKLLKIENESVLLAQENIGIMTERFRLAQCTTLELKESQYSLMNASNRKIEAIYNAQIAESELKRLQGLR